MRRLTAVGWLLLCLLLLLLLNRLHLAGMHLLLLSLRRLAGDWQVGLLGRMARWLLLLCRTHLVKTRWNLVGADHVLSVAGLI